MYVKNQTQRKIKIAVSGMSCAACIGHVERAARSVLQLYFPQDENAENVNREDAVVASLLTARLTVTLPGAVSDAQYSEITNKICAAVQAAGYGAKPATDADGERLRNEQIQKREEKERRSRFIASCLLCALLVGISMAPMLKLPLPAVLTAQRGIYALLQLLLAAAVLRINFAFFRNGFSALFHGAPNMNSLVCVGSGAAFLYGLCGTVYVWILQKNGDLTGARTLSESLYLESAATIVTLVSLGKMLEARASHKAGNAIAALSALAPDTAVIKLPDGTLQTIDSRNLQPGDICVLYAGDRVPADGIVIAGGGTADESALSGESMPVDKMPGAQLYTAAVLSSGYVEIRVTRAGKETTLSKMLDALSDAAASRAPVARFADKISAVFVPVVMGISLLTLVLWLIAGVAFSAALKNAVCVLVISCPCALGLATPTAVTVAAGRGAELGILFRNAAALERCAAVNIVFLDKTGTLTEGRPTLHTVYAAAPFTQTEILQNTAALEQYSNHPLAQAVTAAYENTANRDALPAVSDVNAEASVGVGGMIHEQKWFVGKNVPALSDADTALCDALQKNGETVLYVTCDGAFAGLLGLSDAPKPESTEVIRALHAMRIRTVMVTGDARAAAQAVGNRLGLDEVRAGLLPQDKADFIVSAKRNGDVVMMVGDGINDAQALVSADVGAAVDSARDVTVDSADLVLTGKSLTSLPQALGLSKKAMRIIRQNLFWALGYNALCIPIAAGALYPLWKISLSPMLASLCMSVSSVTVVCNALRLSSYGKQRKSKEKCPVTVDTVAALTDNIIENQWQINVLEEDKMTKEFTIAAPGMMCMHCVAHVKEALEKVPGVVSVAVSLENKNAVVVASDVPTMEEALKNAVRQAGYDK